MPGRQNGAGSTVRVQWSTAMFDALYLLQVAGRSKTGMMANIDRELSAQLGTTPCRPTPVPYNSSTPNKCAWKYCSLVGNGSRGTDTARSCQVRGYEDTAEEVLLWT